MVLRILSNSFRKIAPLCLSVFVSLAAIAEPATSAGQDTAVETTVEAIKPDIPQLRFVPDSVITNLQRQKDFAYANDPAYWKKEEKHESNWLDHLYLFATQQWVKMFVYVLLGAVLLFALYRLVVTNKLYLFYSSSKKRQEQAEEETEIEENLEEKIERAIHARDYRSAIRFMYLKALRLLDAKGWIQFNAKSTNRDYLNALRQYPLAQPFRVITRNYDYVWYGEFGLNEQQFLLLQKNFDQFYNSVSMTDAVTNKQAN